MEEIEFPSLGVIKLRMIRTMEWNYKKGAEKSPFFIYLLDLKVLHKLELFQDLIFSTLGNVINQC